MNRRTFAKSLAVSAAAIGLGDVNVFAHKAAPQFSITMDDFNWANAVKQTPEQRNQSILNTFNKHFIKAAVFVAGRNIEDQRGKDLLAAWDKAGHLIGNHTYS
ncbi:MAG TPA: polysaccharide deacetylase family protein, partial [Pyrinomonadaceae bacterium]|nr:polysaccharide deacetylase family protein [Pyrinomonadaceae bacterium]